MRRAASHSSLATALLIAGLAPAAAERLVTSLSTHQVLITSNFTGTELVLFGSVERDAATVPRRGGYDIVVTVTGPREGMVTRRKEPRARHLDQCESRYLRPRAGLSRRAQQPAARRDRAAPICCGRMEIGLSNVPRRTQPTDIAAAGRAFRDALIRLRKERGLYREEASRVTFLTPNLFRASIPLPAEAPTRQLRRRREAVCRRHQYRAHVVGARDRQGRLRAIRRQRRARPRLLYGLATALMALLTGWFASIVFRRD